MSVGASLETELAALFADELHVTVPSPDTDLLATGRLDSVGLVELLLQLEKRFGVRVDIERLELDQLRSLAAITGFVAARLRRAEGAAAD
jgi:acyl carrier protein